MKKLNVLIIGTGMYVSGRGTPGYGTVLPAVFQWAKKAGMKEIFAAGTGPSGIAAMKKKASALNDDLGTDIRVRYFPSGGRTDKNAYVKAIEEIPRPACAIIAVPDALHKEVMTRTIRAGLHTLVVKPAVLTVDDLRELLAAQSRHRVYCAVEYHKRFDLANLRLRDAIRDGAIGDPLYAIVEYSQRKEVPSVIFKKWVASTNVFQYLGVHYADIIWFATKATPVRAMAISHDGWLAQKKIKAKDAVGGIVEWKMPSGKKFVSYILTSWVDPAGTSAMSDQKIKFIGTKGRFESDQKDRGITVVTDSRGLEEPNPYFSAAYGQAGERSYRGYGIESIRTFLEDAVGIESGQSWPEALEGKRPTLKDSLVSTAVVEAVNKSLGASGNWINIRIKNEK